MGLLLDIYTQDARESVLLPATNNADFQTELPQSKFGNRHPLVLELEILDNQWRFRKTDRYRVLSNGQSWFDKPLQVGDILNLVFDHMTFSVIVSEQSDQLGMYDKFYCDGMGELVIGKDAACDICYDIRDVISRHHASITFYHGTANLDDYSVNGIYRNGLRVRGRVQLEFGDVVDIFGLRMVFLGDKVAINAAEVGAQVSQRVERQRVHQEPSPAVQESPSVDAEDELFHRSPRKIISLHTEPEEIEGPPQKQNANRKPTWMVIGPSFTMAIPMLLGTGFMAVARNMTGTGGNIFMYMGLVTALASAIIGVCWAMINLNYSKKEEKETELLRLQKYGEYLMECAERIREKYEFNRSALLEMYPAARACCDFWRNPQMLWNRNRSHPDFMTYRLGLGDVPFQVPISVPPKKFTLVQDALSNRPREIKQTYSQMQQVPILVDLFKHRVVGIVGSGRADLARALMTQIAANNCYTDVRLAILGDGSTGADWSFMKWLPHVWNNDKSQRYVALDASEISGVCYELTQILRSRTEEEENSVGRKTAAQTQYVVLVESCKLLESEPITKYLYERPETIGVTTLLLAKTFEDLPNQCDFVLENSSRFCGMYSMEPNSEPPQTIQFDQVSERAAQMLARRIAGVRVVESGNGSDLPDSLTFLEMLGVKQLKELNVTDNWRKNRTYQTMQAMVGWKAGGAPCYLNIHEKHHGPHGLVAGTTGSGKSETLQTYILSLAINYSPLDVGFLIIDFKGGGMANLFDGLPHMLGSISNLSGNQVRRAMVSIKSENLRRQRVFGEYGVNHIDAYTKLVKNGEANIPIPHLFIIIDEFAELKREEPEFMRELISVAQVGRSLGVHLILATQKPSGTVDDNIWSNTKFRLCLRVADKQDSKDMLHKVDAAYLTQAGRCYLQVGNDEIYELFQSGWSGAVYDEEMPVQKSNGAVLLGNSGKVVMAGGSTRGRKLAQRRQKWIAALVECCAQACVHPQEDARLDALFALLQQHGLDYTDSTYNRRQMADFIRQYAALFALEPQLAAQRIIQDAQSKGKKLPEQKEHTQLDAVVEHLADVAQKGGYQCDLKLWMPMLPERLLLESLGTQAELGFIAENAWNQPQKKTTLRATVGLVDDPQNQSQFPLVVDILQDGHLAICGAVSSGKSVLMQTLVYSLIQSHTPDMLNIYAIDYSSQMLAPFEELPHTGGIVYEGETDKLSKLFLLMQRIIKERKAMFRGGSFQQYIQANGNVVPAVLLLLDGYASFREKTENEYEAQLMELVRDGAGLGVFVCISAGGFGTGELQSKIGDKMRQVLCQEMDSKYSYGECLRTMHFDVLPDSGIHGRGLAVCSDSVLEYQVALAADGDDYRRSELLRERCAQINALWQGKRAMPIPQIPRDPQWDSFCQDVQYRQQLETGRYLPLGYYRQDASLYCVDLSKTYCYLITGRERSGKSVYLRNVACAAAQAGGKLYMVDKMGQTTEQRTAELVGAQYINTPQGLFDLWKNLILTVNERHVQQKELTQQGLDDVQVFEGLASMQNIFVLIADMADFVNACTNPGSGIPAMNTQADSILQKGAMHRMYFFAALDTQELNNVAVHSMYRSFIKGKQGAHLAGELNTQKMLSYRNVPFAEQSKSMKCGVGHVANPEESTIVDEIVIPMNRGVTQLTAVAEVSG